MTMDQIVVTLESIVEEVQAALEYGRSLGYVDCLNKTVIDKPINSDSDKAIDYYIEQLKNDYINKD